MSLIDKTTLIALLETLTKSQPVNKSLINKEVSDFSAETFHQCEFKTITKADILGKWSVFFFYPADFTFVCPTELEDLADLYDSFVAEGVEIYAVSGDTHFTHLAWHQSSPAIGKVRYPMVGDPSHALAKDFGVYMECNGLSERGTFIVNPEGKIVSYEVAAGNIGRNAAELLRRVQANKFVSQNVSEACPAKWVPGATTLTPGIDLVGKI